MYYYVDLSIFPQKTLSDPAGYLPSHNPRYCAEPLSGQRPEQKFEFIWPQTARRWGAGLEPDYSESYNCRVYDRSVWNYHLAIERRHATGTCGVAWRAAAATGSEHNNDGNQVQTFLLNLVSVPRWCCASSTCRMRRRAVTSNWEHCCALLGAARGGSCQCSAVTITVYPHPLILSIIVCSL